MSKDISIAIVTYNNENIIEKTVDSIINNIPNQLSYEIFIVDNCSTDNTIDIVKKFNSHVQLIESDANKGFGYGHNYILDKLDSKYHFVVNPDIKIDSQDQIMKMYNYLENNSDVGMLSPLILNTDHSIQYLCKKNPTVFDMLIRRISPNLFKKRQDKYVMKETDYNKIMNIDYASGSFMVFRTNVYIQICGFDEDFFMYLEDADITRRVNEISKCIFYPEAYVIHAWERSGHKKIKYALITIKSMIIYFTKWGWKWI